MSLLENIKELSNACGVSGREEEVRDLMIRLLKPYSDEVSLDKLGNVIAIRKGKADKPKVMFAAHIDEVGLMVKTVTKDGFIQFAKMGGIDDRVLLAQKVVIHTSEKSLRGIIGAKPLHVQKEEERKKIINYDELFVDIGAESREQAKALGVKPGDSITFDVESSTIGDDKIIGKAFDNRAGCAIMIEVMKQLDNPDCTVYAVGSVQEELGLRGVGTAAFKLDPDAGIAIDVTIAGDMPGIREFDTSVKIGKGPTIAVTDSGLVTHPKVFRLLTSCAEENKIDYQLETGLLGATDASRISLIREGVPSGTISIPARYIHSPVGLVSLKDLENCAKLAAFAVEKIQNIF